MKHLRIFCLLALACSAAGAFAQADHLSAKQHKNAAAYHRIRYRSASQHP